MSLDSKQKRGAVLELGMPWRAWLADPDSSFDAGDRLSLLKLSSVPLPSSSVSADPGVGNITITGYAPTVVQDGPIALTPDVGLLTITGYAPRVTQSGEQNSGGFLPWNKYAAKRHQEQRELVSEAQSILAEAAKSDADIPALKARAKSATGLLQADIDRLEVQAKRYSERLEKQTSLDAISGYAGATKAAKESRQLLQEIEAKIQADLTEEMDMVFVIMTLAAME